MCVNVVTFLFKIQEMEIAQLLSIVVMLACFVGFGMLSGQLGNARDKM